MIKSHWWIIDIRFEKQNIMKSLKELDEKRQFLIALVSKTVLTTTIYSIFSGSVLIYFLIFLNVRRNFACRINSDYACWRYILITISELWGFVADVTGFGTDISRLWRKCFLLEDFSESTSATQSPTAAR